MTPCRKQLSLLCGPSMARGSAWPKVGHSKYYWVPCGTAKALDLHACYCTTALWGENYHGPQSNCIDEETGSESSPNLYEIESGHTPWLKIWLHFCLQLTAFYHNKYFCSLHPLQFLKLFLAHSRYSVRQNWLNESLNHHSKRETWRHVHRMFLKKMHSRDPFCNFIRYLPCVRLSS